ncbi:DUF6953 family protein [Variovorax boronicumulans]
MTPGELAEWMHSRLEDQGCVYQDEAVDVALYRGANIELCRTNDDGNVVLATEVLAAFKKLDAATVVWVKADRYWRWRCSTDEPGREQRG